MRDAGLQDEGAFSTMEEELLAGEGLWIPRLARIRILSLRDAFNRKNEMVYQAKHGSHYHEVEAFGRDWVGAGGKHFKTKKELEDYQEKQDADEAGTRTYKSLDHTTYNSMASLFLSIFR